MSTALFFSILATTVVGPWLFVCLFGSIPTEQQGGANHMQYWLLGSVCVGIGGIGAWLGFDRQRDIAQQHHSPWVATVRPVVVISRHAQPIPRSTRKTHLRVVGGTAVRAHPPRL